mmetsp:Transcript_67587/g.213871  ORF Transcript_67587/g.213871 Transcript_67587/m.213871 type:complete len:265 (-) Transcript_67587:220-1014(-)
MAALKGSPSGGGSVSVGAASWTTEDTEFSDASTSSLTAGRDSSRSLVSFSSAFFCCSFASAAFAAAWIFVSWARTLLSSAVTVPWTFRTLGESLVSSATWAAPATPPFLASAMSFVMVVCNSMSVFCCVCSDSVTSFSFSSDGSVPTGRASLALASASFAAVSAASTWPVVRWTRSGSGVVSTGVGVVVLPGFGTVIPVVLAPGPVKGSQKRMPGSALGASHGIFQPRRGGLSPWELARAQTWDPPSWSPNHQPPKSAPSRLSQ